jgi:signal transduction histidine kinase
MSRGIAHDIRNILGVISSGLRVAEDCDADRLGRRAALAAAQEGVARGVTMVTRLLAGPEQQEIQPAAANLNALLAGLDMFLKYGAGPGIKVSLQLEPGIEDCVVVAARFNAAILNLVINARDAMPAGGTIEISTLQVIAPPCAPEGARYVRVRVRDDGQGMTAEVASRIFDLRFTTKGDEGTGLGLPQVCAFMRETGGYLTVESEPGAGTSFDLYFPCGHTKSRPASGLWRQIDRWVNEGGAPGTGALSPEIRFNG